MGLFKKLFRKEEINAEDPLYKWMTVDEAIALSSGDKSAISNAVKKIVYEYKITYREMMEKQEDLKQEYALVSEYAADVQKFESLPERKKAEITDSARLILNLDDERTRFKTRDKKISKEQYRNMSTFDAILPQKLEEIRQKEEYLDLVREDMRKIEGEKNIIIDDRNRASDKKKFLYKFTTFVAAAAVLIFIVLLMLMKKGHDELIAAFFITGVGVIGYALYFFLTIRECDVDIKRADLSINRANQLLNKVKIKFVNSSNTLDYMYEKYHVGGYSELRSTWEEYVHEKESEKMYASNTKLLSGYNDKLMNELRRAGFVHAQAWVSQPELLFSRTDFGEYKESIAIRRKALRAQLDLGISQIESLKTEIDSIRAKYPEHGKLFDSIYE